MRAAKLRRRLDGCEANSEQRAFFFNQILNFYNYDRCITGGRGATFGVLCRLSKSKTSLKLLSLKFIKVCSGNSSGRDVSLG